MPRLASIEPHVEISTYVYPGDNDIDRQEYGTACADITGNIYSLD